jgi:UDP-N-acetylglucosamine--N-acetylmuramyl-(pentapeptide) pyrophosphoryl-undecaprenol N-acetylglucosamine transferase
MNNSSCIAFVAGRSGGHIIPGLTLARQYLEQNPDSKIIFFTTHCALDSKIMLQAPAGTTHIPLILDNASIRPVKMMLFMIGFLRSLITSFVHLRTTRPEKVISMGGYISLPVCIAAKMLRIPIELFELNAVPGKATKLLAPLATTIAVPFAVSKKFFSAHKCVVTDYPIRFSAQEKALRPEQARMQLGLPVHKKTVFIQGGSQGSASINKHIKGWLELNPHMHGLISVIHQTGSEFGKWQELYAQYDIPAVVFDFRPDMHVCYAAADLIVSRAGAGALFETLFFAKPCIVIPLQARSTSHQKDNAVAIAQQYPHLFIMVTEEQIRTDNLRLYSTINAMLTDAVRIRSNQPPIAA